MFTRVLVVLPLAVLAVATPARLDIRGQCNTGSASCCNSVQNASDVSSTFDLLGLGAILEGLTGQVGLNCSPLDILGSGAGQCNQEPVCCTGNTFSGLINLGCSPINLNL
ncbi:fungal hydrophobin [Coniophora puteana RWD-64-598 SS2]|uniref:Hydrophobin n=1 Tax=Coniophora puteana (strain RWD-64-598) TaxID=741705 RepID=A0A5M3MEQ2_CONPW|nr:fungal hydrophobin [Coniophora puteana RWD-64-598 SS2]EIW77400.1 fungal hydrophobin [Coniophora puteana RWD-64-598 SS2]